MKNITFLILGLISIGLFSACEKEFVNETQLNDPVENFEIFWSDFDQHYGLFQARGWDWDSIYQVYRPQVTAQTTDEELFEVFKNMITYLDDSHTYVFSEEHEWGFASGETLAELAEEEFSLELVQNKYTEPLQAVPDEEEFYYGRLKDKNVGYIYMENMDGNDPSQIDQVVEELRETDAIIFDVRNNGGGTDEYAARIAGAFADGEHFVYTVQERNGPNHDDFSEKRSFYTEPTENEPYLKPVIILTDYYTVSACEVLLLHMKSFAQVTQIGTPTAGDFSDIGLLRFLPNGWNYAYSIMMFLQPDGTSLDGVGHIPDVFIQNSKADIQEGNDKVMEKTFDYLRETYGIE